MWVTITENDILTRLAAPEVNALKTAATAQGQENPLPEILAAVVREVRGYVAAFPGNKLGPDGTIPDELQVAALNRARYELATRLPVASLLTDARKESNADAIARLRDVAKGTLRIVQPPHPKPAEQATPKLRGYWGSAKPIK